MHSEPELEPHHRQLHRRLKESYGPTYLTVLSVIQGAALADMASVILADYGRLTATQWLLAALNLVMLVAIWNAYASQSVLWEWIPDLRDSVLPFLFGVLELFLNHSITRSLGTWLIAFALLAGAALLANWYSAWRAREEPENFMLLGLGSRKSRRLELLYTFLFGVLLFVLGVISLSLDLQATAPLGTADGQVALLMVVVAALGMGGYVFIVAYNRRQLVNYARTGSISATAAPGPVEG